MGIKFVLVFPAQVRYNKKWIWTGLFFGKGEGKFDEKMENDGIDLCAVRQPVWLRPVFLWNSAGKKGTLTFVCGEKNVEMQADEEADGGKLSEQDGTEVQMTDASETVRDGTASADTSVTSTQSDTSYSDGKVNINTAGLEELMTLKGVGESRARAIIEYREQQGAFETPEDIMNISGIKEGVFSKIKDQIAVR